MTDEINMTVKQLASLAGVSIRTLHYYDEIGLLKPDSITENGYRHYGEQAVLRLQQILFYRELGMTLESIRDLVARPEFDALRALQVHRTAMQERSKRLDLLINTVDKTIEHLEGKREMNQSEYFEGWTEEKQPEFEKEIRQKYGEHAMEGAIDWNSYTKEQKTAIITEGQSNIQAIADLMEQPASSPEVQSAVARWHQYMKYFYDPSIERMRSLGQMYIEDARFMANYEKVRIGLALFMKQAIDEYCDSLEENK